MSERAGLDTVSLDYAGFSRGLRRQEKPQAHDSTGLGANSFEMRDNPRNDRTRLLRRFTPRTVSPV